MKTGLRKRGPGLAKLKALAKLIGARPEVKIGVLGTAAAAQHNTDAMTNAELAAIHEFGAPRAHVPERSFLRSTADRLRAKWLDLLERVMRNALRVEGVSPADRLFADLELVGLRASHDVIATIRKGIPPPLAPATIARKGSTKPLIDTGRLVQSISYEVVRRSR